MEAEKYFKSDPTLMVIMNELIKKYYTYGRFTGTISKEKLENHEQLLGFLGINETQWDRTKRFKIEDFIEAFERSKFSQVKLSSLVVSVTNHKLITKEEIGQEKHEHLENYLSEIKVKAPLVCQLLDKSELKRYFNKNVPVEMLMQVNFVLNNLPSKKTRLPVVAYNLLQDPHGLDEDQLIGSIFLKSLEKKFPNGKSKNERYLNVNIVKDDILNFVTVRNLSASSAMFHAAAKTQAIWNVSLHELLNVSNIVPVKGKKVFIIENSSVYSVITDHIPDVPLIMSGGQFNFAMWKLLELLPEEIQIYYASDMDPAGLVMCQNLWQRFGSRIKFFGMSVDIFDKYEKKW